ncbi:hypothetical protein HK100_003586 [Physocladia obscura]|uniref:ABC transporter domain-containing protein n=1 Tax=Physocladia obscura TaxID=109957 RepID=A0AAD5SW15_9FUNG|nr:hypothetical protein HK100_003586 [Physocladia obscura]
MPRLPLRWTADIRAPSLCAARQTTLLRALAHLLPTDKGYVTLVSPLSSPVSYTPATLTPPQWRRAIVYVAQRPAQANGSPRDYLRRVTSFKANAAHGHPIATSHSDYSLSDPIAVASTWNVAVDCWDKPWNQLSGGESQRITLSIALSLNPTVLLLDEPTSALDPDTTLLVEDSLKNFNCLWITHSPEQEKRVSSACLSFIRHPTVSDAYTVILDQ